MFQGLRYKSCSVVVERKTERKEPSLPFWIATSQDVPGLVLESDSIDALLERVRFTVPELIELNRNMK